MKKKILIANVGNRTIMKEAKNGGLLPLTEFREDLELHEEMQDYSELKLKILNQLIDKFSFENIILFSSDSSGLGERNALSEKDTRKVGEILKNVIPLYNVKYTKDQIQNIVLNCNMVREDELIKSYQKHIQDLLQKFPLLLYEWIVCDSGGTPQQKSAMKIILDFLLKYEDYKLYQVEETQKYDDKTGALMFTGDSNLQLMSRASYRKIFAKQQVSLLISKGNYQAAAFLWKASAYNKEDDLYFILLFWHYRITHITENAMKFYALDNTKTKRFIKDNKDNQQLLTLLSYFKESHLPQYLTGIINNKNYQNLIEVLHCIVFYKSIGVEDWGQVVLQSHVFIEKLSWAITTNYGLNQSFRVSETDENFYSEAKEFLKSSSSDFQNVRDSPYYTFDKSKVVLSTITQILYAETKVNQNSGIRDIITTFKECEKKFRSDGKGLDQLRNRVAHDGKGCTKDKLNEHVPRFEEYLKLWCKNMGVSSNIEDNLFIKANKEIDAYLKQI